MATTAGWRRWTTKLSGKCFATANPFEESVDLRLLPVGNPDPLRARQHLPAIAPPPAAKTPWLWKN